MTIHRQDAETTIPELAGSVCEELLGVGKNASSGMVFFFIKLSGVLYRFFLDVGVLFWEEGAPDSEDDLDESEEYLDMLKEYSIKPGRVAHISMRDWTLSIEFGDGTLIIFDNKRDDDAVSHVTVKH